MSRIHIIHENDAWTAPLRAQLEALGAPYQDWFMNQGQLNLDTPPPQGVFYNRMSASSHTRNHRYAAEYTACVLAWLERYNRRIINTSRALGLEVNKALQYTSLNAYGIRTPRTIAAVGRKEILNAARTFKGAFITKPNRGGKGLGVRLFEDREALQRYVDSPSFEESLDGVTLVQEYIRAREPSITRVEFVGGAFLYAVRVNTSNGFELCPADECQPDDSFCPTTQTPHPRFNIVEDFDHPIIDRYAAFLSANGIEIAGIEFITDINGQLYTYDVNTNTNYNSDAEAKANASGMQAIARYLSAELAHLDRESTVSRLRAVN